MSYPWKPSPPCEEQMRTKSCSRCRALVQTKSRTRKHCDACQPAAKRERDAKAEASRRALRASGRPARER